LYQLGIYTGVIGSYAYSDAYSYTDSYSDAYSYTDADAYPCSAYVDPFIL
jgi:hypothetical protein